MFVGSVGRYAQNNVAQAPEASAFRAGGGYGRGNEGAALLGVQVDRADDCGGQNEVRAGARGGAVSRSMTIGTKTRPGWPVAMIRRHPSASAGSQQATTRTARGHLFAFLAVVA